MQEQDFYLHDYYKMRNNQKRKLIFRQIAMIFLIISFFSMFIAIGFFSNFVAGTVFGAIYLSVSIVFAIASLDCT